MVSLSLGSSRRARARMWLHMYQRIEDPQIRVQEPVLDQMGDLVPGPNRNLTLHLDMNVDPQRQTALAYAKQVYSIHAGHGFGDLPDAITNVPRERSRPALRGAKPGTIEHR